MDVRPDTLRACPLQAGLCKYAAYIPDPSSDNGSVWMPKSPESCRTPKPPFAALVHAQFETIHPFDDGSGRTGRALIHVVLHRRGLAPSYVPPISVVLAGARDRYIDGLTRFREGRTEEWIEGFASAAASAARLATAYLEAVQTLGARWRAQLAASPSAPRADAAAWAVIDILPGHPLLTAPVPAAVTGRSKPSIYQALGQLEMASILQPLSKARRNRSWEAVGLLDLLAGLEAGRLVPRVEPG